MNCFNPIFGSICGDVIGSGYEWDNAKSWDDVGVLSGKRKYALTDDTVLVCAVAKWLLVSEERGLDALVKELKEWPMTFPYEGYGPMFVKWLKSEDSKPYRSIGNGSAMRTSPCAVFGRDLDDALKLAKMQAAVTHNTHQGENGAMAITEAIWMAKEKKTKDEIKETIARKYGYDLNRTIDEIRGTHPFDATCNVTVPEAIIAFFEGEDFVGCMKKCIYVGGDTDTICCMCGGIAAAYYGVPDDVTKAVRQVLPPPITQLLKDLHIF